MVYPHLPLGVTMKPFKEEDSTPEFLDFKVTTPEAWAEAKACMTLSDDRIPWDEFKVHYNKWRAENRWIRAVFWFGFDVAHLWMMVTENMLVKMIEEPEFVEDVFDTYGASVHQRLQHRGLLRYGALQGGSPCLNSSSTRAKRIA